MQHLAHCFGVLGMMVIWLMWFSAPELEDKFSSKISSSFCLIIGHRLAKWARPKIAEQALSSCLYQELACWASNRDTRRSRREPGVSNVGRRMTGLSIMACGPLCTQTKPRYRVG